MVKKIGQFLTTDNRRTYILAFVLTLLGTPGMFVSGILVGFISLQKNYKTGLAALAWVALPAISLAILHNYNNPFNYFTVWVVLLYFFVLLIQRTENWRLALQLLTVLGIIFMLGVHLLFLPYVKSWLIFQLDLAAKMLNISLTGINNETYVNTFIRVMTFLFLVALFIQLILIRCWHFAIAGSSQLKQELAKIRVGYFEIALLIVATAALFWHSALMPSGLKGCYLILLFPFFVAGFNLLHNFLNKRKGAITLLIFVCILLSLINAEILISVLVLVGLLDGLFNVRTKRFFIEGVKS